MTRRLLVAFFLLITAVPAWAQQGSIAFDALTHDFRTIEEGERARYEFVFRNVGDGPLHVRDVRPSCGCTVPSWTEDPVAPGDEGAITVVYNSKNRPGTFHKSIRVITDGDPEMVTLHISGTAEQRGLTDGVEQGHLLIDRDVVDLGTIARADGLTYTYRLQNVGARPIRIEDVSVSDTSVTITRPEKPIYSNRIAELSLRVDAASLPADSAFTYDLVLVTDDALQPEKTLQLRGRTSAE